MTTPDEANRIDAYRDALNRASPDDPLVDARDPSITPRLTLPTELRRFQPTYPPEVRRERIQGRVLLAGVIEKDGSVSNIKVVSSTGNPELDKASVDTFRQWRYKPAHLDGHPVRLLTMATMTFTLR